MNSPIPLPPTPLMDHDAPALRALIRDRGWAALPRSARIAAVHDFVRDEIAFGYNARDAIPASQVLAEGIGQCNTKATLLMTLLRALGIEARLRGFTIDKALQRGVVPEAVYPIAPAEILHSWVELPRPEGPPQVLEGFILDAPYLAALQAAFPGRDRLCGYGAGTERLQAPPLDARAGDTLIQSTGIARDLGVFETADAFHARHAQAFGWLKNRLYSGLIRHWMTARVRAIRAGRLVPHGGATRLPPRSAGAAVTGRVPES